jgi:hypothetical protein
MEVAMNPQRDWHSEYEHTGETREIGQPDPALQDEPASPLRVGIYVVGAIVVLGIVLYGLNQPHKEVTAEQSAAPPAGASAPASGQASGGNAPATTGAAPQDNKQESKRDNKPQASPPQGKAQPDTNKAQ